MRRLALVLASTILPASAWAADWRLTGSGADMVQFIDKQSLKRESATVEFIVYQITRDKDDGFDGVIARMAVQCSTLTYKVLSADSYAGRKRLAALPTVGTWTQIDKYSVDKESSDRACAGVPDYLPKFADPVAYAQRHFARYD